MSDRYDVVIVGGGHNGLVAASYLAGAGLSVVVLERREVLGGAAVSSRAFSGVDVRLSRYSYLVSLLPKKIVSELGLRVELRKRPTAFHPPVAPRDAPAWREFAELTGRVGRRCFASLTEPLVSRREFRALIDDERAWRMLFEEPLGVALEELFADDTVRGTVLTDGLIGTFADAHDPELRQNRCLLYHVIGNGTGDWDVPVGGMGAVSGALEHAARAAGAELVTGAEVFSVDPDGEVRYRHGEVERVAGGRFVLANVAPRVLAGLLGPGTSVPSPEGAQLKVNMVLQRLPRLRDSPVPPETAFGGTFHVNEGYAQLARAYAEAARGEVPSVPPCEIYCHSLTDPSILGARERAAGAQTLTLFGLHMPGRLFAGRNDEVKAVALRATLASLNAVLAEPVEECLWLDGEGRPCLEAKSPVDLEAELGMPGGHIFHGDLSWPFAEDDRAGTWGVETEHDRIFVCGAGAIRGGGVSGIPGHNAARAVLARS
ncbi:phytoene desaturase family protein [Amycolatopsis anabasis]|uniref:phytoene desaturase family protein n=1 Tax=Amycolatopsis anabasis TaxID=1840409 RepID=UPI00131AFCB1|nr:NAD(P)/FAD-dependent oxidoreductase [Amycolatopsis anabasis]